MKRCGIPLDSGGEKRWNDAMMKRCTLLKKSYAKTLQTREPIPHGSEIAIMPPVQGG